ncbi:MAG TPA: alpha/beta fold hydrolase [Methylibium sp.]|nr:alpha/beta fold hydrolase [Methylibium sp.]
MIIAARRTKGGQITQSTRLTRDLPRSGRPAGSALPPGTTSVSQTLRSPQPRNDPAVTLPSAPALPAGQWLPEQQGHRVWWAGGGAATGLPVLVVHGGPGGQSRPEPARWFDGLPVRWLMLDQRGCGRSEPAGATAASGLPELLDDIERLREALGLERWALAGGSWGARVALAYAARHPARVDGLMLRSPFLGTLAETRRYIAPWSNWLGAAGRQGLGPEAADAVHSLYHGRTESFIGDSGLTRGACLAADAVVLAWGAFDDAQSAPGGVAASGARWSEPSAAPTPAQRASWAVHVQGALGDWGERDGVPRGLVLPRLAAGAPVELIWGEQDATCDPASARALAAALAESGLAVRSCGVAGAGHRMGDPLLAPRLRAVAQGWVASLLAQPDASSRQRSLR